MGIQCSCSITSSCWWCSVLDLALLLLLLLLLLQWRRALLLKQRELLKQLHPLRHLAALQGCRDARVHVAKGHTG